MRKLISAVSKISTASFFNIIVGIIRTKVFAVILGTVGIGIMSQLMNFYNLIVLITSVGIPLGLTKFIAEWESEDLWAEIKQIISQSIVMLMVFGIISMLVIIFFAENISFLLLGETKYSTLVIILSLSIPMTLIGSFFDAFIKGLKRFKNFLYISVTTTFISLILTVVLTYFFNVTGAIISIGISGAIYVASYILYFVKSNTLKLKDFFTFNFNYSERFTSLIKLAFAYLLVGSIELITQTLIRTLLIQNLNISANGIYQCVYSISNNYFSIIFMSLSMYLLPTLSSIKDKEEANMEINNTLRLTFIALVPILTLIFTFRDLIIILFYSSEFLPSSDLLFFYLLGDYFRAISAVIGTWLVPAFRIKMWIYISFIYYSLLSMLFIVLLTFYHLGLESVIIAYLFANFINTAVNIYCISRYNKFRLSYANVKLIILSFLFIIVIFILSFFKFEIVYYIVAPCLIIWIFLSVNRSERSEIYSRVRTIFANQK